MLLRDAQNALDDLGRADVSIWCAEPQLDEATEGTEDRICQVAANFFSGKWFRSSAVAAMLASGFEPRQDDPDAQPHPFHYDVDLGTVDPETAERFFSTFVEEKRNARWVAG